MTTILVVANETLASSALLDAVRERAAKSGATNWIIAAPLARPSSGRVSYDDVARGATQHRVDDMVAQLVGLGLTARGEVMDPDPFSATMDAIGEFHPDEIIISTHPETRSGWLRRDLLERVSGASGLPVTHVVADLDAEGADVTNTLVVANKTAQGSPLVGLLKGKAEEKRHRFIVVVPQSDGPDDARTRLDEVVTELKTAGLDAGGTVGDPDPYTAVMNALSFFKVDEIVISTHPATRSGWLRADLIERVRRATSRPVEHVVVDIERARPTAASRA
jgi:hypothetical protein